MVGSGGRDQRANKSVFFFWKTSLSVLLALRCLLLSSLVSLDLEEGIKGTNTTWTEEYVSVIYFCFETDISK
jgi:hypothetical protein